MSDVKHGGPAFPHQKEDGTPYWGMSLRDWFAGQALAGIMANQSWFKVTTDEVAMSAYHLADAMLAARAEQKGQTDAS